MTNKQKIDQAIAALKVAMDSTINEIALSASSGGAGRSSVYAPTLNGLFDAITKLEAMSAAEAQKSAIVRGPSKKTD